MAPTDRLSPPLFCSTTVPTRPVIVPPIVFLQTTWTLVTLPLLAVPLPLVTVHCCGGLAELRTVTLYVPPVSMAVAKVKGPLALSVLLSPPLSCSTRVPTRPETLPPMVFLQTTWTLVTLPPPLFVRTRPVPTMPETVPLTV